MAEVSEKTQNYVGTDNYDKSLPTSLEKVNVSDWWIALAIFTLAVAIRFIYLYDLKDNPTFNVPIVDSYGYHTTANSLVQGHGMGEKFFWQQFFYPFYLSVVYLLTGSSILYARILQALLGGLTCLLTYRLGSRIFNRKTGVIAGVITATYGPLIFFEAELLVTGWAAFWSVLLLLTLLKTAETKSLRLCLLFGICGALSTITRSNFFPFFFCACLWLAVIFYRFLDWRGLLAPLAAISAGFILIAWPVASQAYRVTRSFTIFPASAAFNLYIGNHPDFEAGNVRPGFKWDRTLKEPEQHNIFEPDDKKRYFYKKTLNFVLTQPLGFLKGLFYKTAQFASSREIPGHVVDIYVSRKWAPSMRLLVWKIWGFGFPFGLLLPLTILGIIYHRQKVPLPIVLFLLLYSASIILVHMEARYRVAMVPIMAIPASAACLKIVDIIRMRQWRTLAITLLCIAAVMLLCSLPGPFSVEKNNYEAELYYNIGQTLQQQGDINQALPYFTKAIELRDDYIEAHNNMGAALLRLQKTDEAQAHFNKAIQYEPDYYAAHANLATILAMKGEFRQAIEHFTDALRVVPNDAHVHNYLANALSLAGRLSEAVEHYNESLRLIPNNPSAHYNLAVTLEKTGDLDSAAGHYREVLKMQPYNSQANARLREIMAKKNNPQE